MMKRAFILICILLSFVLFSESGSLFSAINEPGDDLQTLPLPSNNSLKSAQPAVPKPYQPHPKLTSALSRFLDIYHSKGATEADEYARIHDITFSEGRVLVELMLRRGYLSDDVSPTVLKRFGVEIDHRSEHFIIVRIPVKQLAEFAENIDNVSLIHRPFRAVADVTSEGVELIGANAFHEENITGQDVSVAIVDIGFNRLSDGQDAGELPENPTIRNFTDEDMDEGSIHGSACTEIVYDLVPDANFYLMKVANDADLENAIDFLIDEEVDVISMSLSWIVAIDDYFQGGDYLSRKVNEAFDHGILYVNSAGNYANSHYRNEFDDQNEDDDWHRFTDGVTVNHFGTAVDRMYNIDEGTSLWATMAWDDFPESGQDFDLYMVWWNEEQDSWDIVAESRNPQNGDDPPYEYISYRAERDGSYGVMVHSETGDNGMDFTLVTAYDIAYRTRAGSVLIPAIAEDNFAVGAVFWREWNEDEPNLESFSSQGPTYDGRTKPEISAPDGTTSFIYEREFFGTSASCPHVAGAAALMLSAYPHWDNVELRDYLQENAVDVGDEGQDNLFGYGLLNIELNGPGPPRIIVDPPSIEIEILPDEDVYATSINISNEGESDLYFHTEIEIINEPPRDRIEGRSLRSVSTTGAPRRDDLGDEIARFSFDIEPDDHFIASSAWDEDNDVMWLPFPNLLRAYTFDYDYGNIQLEVNLGIQGPVTGLACMNGVLYVATWGSDDLLRYDIEGNNLGNLEMPRRPVIIAASEEMERLMVIDDPDGDNMYFYEVADDEVRQTDVLNWRVEQLGEGDCRGICWVDRHPDGQLWIMVDDGLYEFAVDEDDLEIIEIVQDLEYQDNQWFSVSHDRYNLWLGTENHPEWSIIDDGITELCWIMIDPGEGILEPNQDMDIDVVLNATGCLHGIYEAAIHFISNDPENPDEVVRVEMEVMDCPAIDVRWPEEAGYPDLIDWNGWFDDLFPPGEYPLPIVVENVGNRDLEIEIFVEGNDFDILGEERFVLRPREETEILLIFLGDEPGIYEAFLYFISNDPNDEELRIPMRAVVEGNRPPEIAREIPDQQLREDFEPFVVADLDIVFDDPEGDELYFWAGSDDENLQTDIDEDNRLRLSVTENWVGQAHVTVIADDDPIDERDAGPVRTLRSVSGRSEPVRDEPVELTFSVEIENVNDPPRFTAYPDEIYISEGYGVLFMIVFWDADFNQLGDTLSFRLLDDDGLRERGAQFEYNSPYSVLFRWFTGFDDAGIYRPVFAVEDVAGARDVGSFSLIVHDVNRYPDRTAPLPDIEFTEDDEGRIIYNLNDYITDPDGDELQFSAEGEGLRAMVSPDGWLWVEPVPNWNGETELDLWANDGRGEIMHFDIDVSVAPVNDLPTPFSLLTPEEGDTVRSYPTVHFSWEPSTDVEDSTIIYTLELNFANGGGITLRNIDEPEVEVPRNWLAVEPDQPRGIDWYIRANDGIDSIRSDETFSIVIAPLSVDDSFILHPSSFILLPSYPNPFNDVITISYAVPRQTEMSLSIIDPLGRHIRTLEHGGISAGRYVTHWDGCNQNGMKVSSGMYICLLTTPEGVLLQRIVLLR